MDRAEALVLPKTCPQCSTRPTRLADFRSFPGSFDYAGSGYLVEPLLFRVVLYALNSDNTNPRFAALLSPLPDSNRGPPPYHGGFALREGDRGTALLRRFSCNYTVSSVRRTPPSKSPESP
jgi:hypothetical protein